MDPTTTEAFKNSPAQPRGNKKFKQKIKIKTAANGG